MCGEFSGPNDYCVECEYDTGDEDDDSADQQILTQGEEGLDFIFVVSSDLNKRGRNRHEYQLSIDFTKH